MPTPSPTRWMGRQLVRMLDQLRKRSTYTQGYGPKNMLRLLRALHGQLRGLDLSHLFLRGADLQGIEMQDTDLSGATLRDTLFTGTFNLITAIAASPDGRYWAAGNQLGELRVWLEGGQTLYRAWQAHTDQVFTIAFSPDGHTLATGGWDGSAKVWDVEQGTLLWTGSHPAEVHRVVFSPDGRTLASGGNDEAIRFWDAQRGTLIRTLSTPGGPIFALAWHPAGRLLASAGPDHQIRLWDVQAEQPGENVRLLPGHTGWHFRLAFSPDGRILASSGCDGSVRLWDVDNLRLRETLAGHTGLVFGLAWCPDGNLLASCGDRPDHPAVGCRASQLSCRNARASRHGDGHGLHLRWSYSDQRRSATPCACGTSSIRHCTRIYAELHGLAQRSLLESRRYPARLHRHGYDGDHLGCG